MKMSMKVVAAALAFATTFGVLPATAASAQTHVSISYRDYDYRGGQGYRGDYRDWRGSRHRWDRDRDGIPNRYDRYDNRRHWGWNDGRRSRHCWSEWRYDRRRDDRVRVRVCR